MFRPRDSRGPAALSLLGHDARVVSCKGLPRFSLLYILLICATGDLVSSRFTLLLACSSAYVCRCTCKFFLSHVLYGFGEETSPTPTAHNALVASRMGVGLGAPSPSSGTTRSGWSHFDSIRKACTRT